MYKIVDFGLRYESKKNDKMKYFFSGKVVSDM